MKRQKKTNLKKNQNLLGREKNLLGRAKILGSKNYWKEKTMEQKHKKKKNTQKKPKKKNPIGTKKNIKGKNNYWRKKPIAKEKLLKYFIVQITFVGKMRGKIEKKKTY